MDYFIFKFEKDIQLVFDEISSSKGFRNINVKKSIKKSSMFHKGDFFLPLLGSDASHFSYLQKELLSRFKKILYILHSEITTHGNLLFHLNRPVIYRSILQELSQLGERYGMVETDKSILILVNNEKLQNFNALRSKLIADHVASFLIANSARVYYNESEINSKFLPSSRVSVLLCSEDCSLINSCEEIEEKAKCSEWRKSCFETNGCLCLDARKFVECNGLLEKYDKGLNNICLSKSSGISILNHAVYIRHLLQYHIPEMPDIVVNIVYHGHKKSAYESCLLLQIIYDICSSWVYVVHQSTNTRTNSEISTNDFILYQKKEIEEAMIHKYDSNILEDKIWASRIDILVNSAIKFDFLRISPNMPLKLEIPNNRNNPERSSGIFVQYNFARLSNIFKNFELKVEGGYYKPLPLLETIDFSLLKLEEEWNLFSYILSFPKMIQEIFDSICTVKTKPYIPINRICIMLSELCHHLSMYYSRIRILGLQQEQLQKVMHARLWLLKGVQQIMKNSFLLLNIQGLDQM